MFHCTGFYFCTRSNWDNEFFEVRNLVSIECDSQDFKNLIEKKPFGLTERPWVTYDSLKTEVFDWLENNVKEQKEGIKGWCCGNNEYNSNSESFSLFFYRRKDAMLFIKTWSIYKKATKTFNQNTMTKRILDPKTNTLKKLF